MFPIYSYRQSNQRVLSIDSRGMYFYCFGIFLIALALLFPVDIWAEESREIAVSWTYSGDVSELAGFKVYQDGVEKCSTDDPNLRQMSCTVIFGESASVFTMTAYNTDGLETTGSATFQVDSPIPPAGGNVSPNAVATTNVLQGVAPLSVNFDGSGSNDSDGMITFYSWNFGDGSNGTGAMVDKVFSSPGLYSAVLTVTDDQGATGQVATLITVTDSSGEVANDPPSAIIVASTHTGYAPMSVVFDGSGSNDLDGEITAYSWDFGDGDVGSGVSTSHSFSSPGVYTVRLTVMDSDGDTSVASTTISVQQQQTSGNNSEPSASFSPSSQTGEMPVRISFDGSSSQDSDGTLVGYYWDFGDGSTGNGMNAQHVFDAVGQFTVTLIVTDDQGAMAQAQTVITITATQQSNASPLADFAFLKQRDRVDPRAGIGEQVESTSLLVEFDASSSVDSDGSIVDFLWDFGDGDTDDGASTEHTYAMSGVYTVTLSIMDNEGATASVEKLVSLTDAPVAYDSTVITNAGDTVQGFLESEDSANLVYAIVSQGSKGTATLLDPSTGQFVYTPDVGESGVDSFTFQVSDGGLDSNTATVTVSIASQNAGGDTGGQPTNPLADSGGGGGGGCSLAGGHNGPTQSADWLLVAACLAWLGLQPIIRNKR